MRRILFIFAQLNEGDIEWLAVKGRTLELKPGTVIVQEGKPIDALSIVIDGQLSVSVGSQEVARLGCGEVVGELSFLDDKPPSATVRAVEPSLVLAVQRADIRGKMQKDDGFAARLYHALGVFLASRLRTSMARMGYAGNAEEADELSDDMLSDVSVAGARFDWLVQRVRGQRARAR